MFVVGAGHEQRSAIEMQCKNCQTHTKFHSDSHTFRECYISQFCFLFLFSFMGFGWLRINLILLVEVFIARLWCWTIAIRYAGRSSLSASYFVVVVVVIKSWHALVMRSIGQFVCVFSCRTDVSQIRSHFSRIANTHKGAAIIQNVSGCDLSHAQRHNKVAPHINLIIVLCWCGA